MKEKTFDFGFKQQKFTDEQLKKEAERILADYCPPDDALEGESLEGYQQRKRTEAINRMALNPQATSRPFYKAKQ